MLGSPQGPLTRGHWPYQDTSLQSSSGGFWEWDRVSGVTSGLSIHCWVKPLPALSSPRDGGPWLAPYCSQGLCTHTSLSPPVTIPGGCQGVQRWFPRLPALTVALR